MASQKPTIHTTPSQSDTYNSSQIRLFTWRERPDDEEYSHGQLLVRFRHNVESRHEPPPEPQPTVYVYDVPVEAYDEMKWRAEEVGKEDKEMTVGEWFSNVFPKKPYTPKTRPLYKDCLKE